MEYIAKNKENKNLLSKHEKKQRNSPKQIIMDYLKKKNYQKTLDIFKEEIKIIKENKAPFTEIIKSFEEGKKIIFFELWKKIHKSNNSEKQPIQENIKLELYIRLYFIIKNIKNKEENEYQENINSFKIFLEERGSEISRFQDLISFFALPYVKKLEEHSSFKNYFKEEWKYSLKNKLKKYFKELFQKKSEITELENLLLSINEFQNSSKKLKKEKINIEESSYKKKIEEMNKLKSDLLKKKEDLKNQEIESKETMKLIHQKWANFVNETLEVSKSYNSIIKNYSLSKEDEEKIINCSQKINDYEKFLLSSVKELFYESESSVVLNKSKFRLRQSALKILDFSKIKSELKNSLKVEYLCSILEALRWKITKAKTPIMRRETIIQFTSYEVIDYDIFCNLLDKKNKIVNEYLIAFLNSMSSEYLGRSYLIENEQMIKHLIYILKNEKEETFIRKNTLGILQKLSLRKKAQEILIQNNIIKWTIDILSKESNTLSDYSLEYFSALLLNLSLRTIGKNKFEENKYTALNLLFELMDSKNPDLQTYINGTLYSLFTRAPIQNLAKQMNFEQKLKLLIENNEEEISKRYSYILNQLLSDMEEGDLEELNEDENDLDLVEDEDFWVEEENENPESVFYEVKGEQLLEGFRLEGDEADKVFLLANADYFGYFGGDY